MRIKKILIASLICLSVPAAAEPEPTLKAYEVELADLRLPGNSNGTLAFKACDECAYQTVRVTAATAYEANGRSYTLEAYRAEVERVADPHDRHVTVMHNLETNTITAVRARF